MASTHRGTHMEPFALSVATHTVTTTALIPLVSETTTELLTPAMATATATLIKYLKHVPSIFLLCAAPQ